MKTLTIGQPAPNFKGTNQNGKQVSLADFKGKKLVLYFYPKDNTPGCTAESCNLADNYDRLRKQGFEILGVSADDEKSHVKFITKFNLPFDLIADTEHLILEDYGCWGPKKFMGKDYIGIHRKTFVIDENGILLLSIEKVNTKDHAAQIMDELGLK